MLKEYVYTLAFPLPLKELNALINMGKQNQRTPGCMILTFFGVPMDTSLFKVAIFMNLVTLLSNTLICFTRKQISWEWWCMPVLPALRRQRQVVYNFKASLGYIVSIKTK
jgi:hypothetical protein